MTTPSRRLGRGLGAFLDFGPADGDGAARVFDAIAAAEAKSILETSAQVAPPKPVPVAAKPQPVPVTAKQSPVAPPKSVPVAPKPAPAPVPEPPAADDSAFIDDIVVGLSFPDVELE